MRPLLIHIFLATTAYCLSVNVTAAATELPIDKQRETFREAWKAAQERRLDDMRKLRKKLPEDYILIPYLEYAELRKFDPNLVDRAIKFVQTQDDTLFPYTERIRDIWIEGLAKQGNWEKLLDLYDKNAKSISVKSHCLVLTARFQNNNHDDYDIKEQAEQLFLTGTSQPEECDPLFEKLYYDNDTDKELVWERVKLAFSENRPGLVRYLGQHLDNKHRDMLERWLEMHDNPKRGLSKLPQKKDTAEVRDLAMYGIKRMSITKSIDDAIDKFNQVKKEYSFTTEETDPVLSYIGIRAVKREHSRMVEIMDMVETPDAATFAWQLVAALRSGRWQELLEWTIPATDEEMNTPQRSYWHARALMETGKTEEANKIFEVLAKNPDYYGYAAADKTDKIKFRHMPENKDRLEQVKEKPLPVVERAIEWFRLRDGVRARREWLEVWKHLDANELVQAAISADKEDWDYGVIRALDKANEAKAEAQEPFGISELQFPTPELYEGELGKAVDDNDLNKSWLYGLVRAESAFAEDISSAEGALGLMQVMPATGAEVASELGKTYSSNMLRKAEYNITIGSKYLKDMYDRFNKNLIYATVAYNAGPGRVDKWKKVASCTKFDMWIETIPFSETRQYVKNVLLYSAIYDLVLGEEVAIPISDRIGDHWRNCHNQKQSE